MARRVDRRRMSRTIENRRQVAIRALSRSASMRTKEGVKKIPSLLESSYKDLQAQGKISSDAPFSTFKKSKRNMQSLINIMKQEGYDQDMAPYQKIVFELATMSTKGLSLEETRDLVRRSSDIQTRMDMQRTMNGDRRASQRRGSALRGMTRSELKVFFAVTSKYARGIDRVDKMKSIREGINKDFAVDLKTDAEVIDFVRKSEAFKNTLKAVPHAGPIDTDELGNYYLEGDWQYEEYDMLSTYASRYRG